MTWTPFATDLPPFADGAEALVRSVWGSTMVLTADARRGVWRRQDGEPFAFGADWPIWAPVPATPQPAPGGAL